MPAKRKPQPAGAPPVPARPVGRPAMPGADHRISKTISLPTSLWRQLEATAKATGASRSTIAEQHLTTKSHL